MLQRSSVKPCSLTWRRWWVHQNHTRPRGALDKEECRERHPGSREQPHAGMFHVIREDAGWEALQSQECAAEARKGVKSGSWERRELVKRGSRRTT